MIGRTYQVDLEDPKSRRGTYQIEFGRLGEDRDLLNAYYGPLRDTLKESHLEISRDDLTFVLTWHNRRDPQVMRT
jgi:hypothetical protein